MRILTLLFLLISPVVFGQRILARKAEWKEESIKMLKENKFQFYTEYSFSNIRLEKKHNQTIQKFEKLFGKAWRDSLLLKLNSSDQSMKDALNETKTLSSLHSTNTKKRTSCDLFFDKRGFIIQKKSKVRSNRRYSVIKEWTLNENGEITDRVKLRTKK